MLLNVFWNAGTHVTHEELDIDTSGKGWLISIEPNTAESERQLAPVWHRVSRIQSQIHCQLLEMGRSHHDFRTTGFEIEDQFDLVAYQALDEVVNLEE